MFMVMAMSFPAVAAADTYFTITAPIKGQDFPIGDNLTFFWELKPGLTNPQANYSIHRFENGTSIIVESDSLFSAGQNTSGELSGNIFLAISEKYTPSDYYKIDISYTDSAGHSGTVWSDYFSIVNASDYKPQSVHAAGTHIKTSDGTVYLIDNYGKRRPYTSAGAFLSYKSNSWANVAEANVKDLALPIGEFIPPRDGTIMCDDRVRIGTCYLITEGWKIGFVTAQHFEQLGFSFKKALYGDVSFMGEKRNIESGVDAHLPGTIVSDGKTFYFVGKSSLLGIPSPAVLNAWGYTFEDAVPMNTADYAKSRSGILPNHQAGQISPLF